MNRIVVVGVLDDGPHGLAPQVLRRVEAAEVLAGGRRHLALFPAIAAERIPLRGDLDAVVERLRAARTAGRRVVVLASGDPLFHGIGRLLVRQLGREALEFHPNVSSVALAFARIGEPWEDAIVASCHGRGATDVAALVREHDLVALLTDGVNTPGAIARELLAANIDGYTMHVCANLGGTKETVWRGEPAEAAAQEFPLLNVTILARKQGGGA